MHCATGLRLPPARVALRETIGRLGVPPEVLEHVAFPTVFASRRTERALAGSGIACPDLESYAATLWSYWEEHLDDRHRRATRRCARRSAGRTVVITGASSGIGKVTALKVAQAGGIPLLVARGKDKLEETRAEIEARGGTALVYACDLSDLEAIDALCDQLVPTTTSVDFVVNNAGRSIRRSLGSSRGPLPRLRAHHAAELLRRRSGSSWGCCPRCVSSSGGHVVNVSSIGVQTNPPRFSAYVASKAALDAWSNVVSSELVGDGISFTTVHMPLVRTPMIAPTKIYQKFPTITPAQAADMVMRAMVERPHEINTALGTSARWRTPWHPQATFRVLHLAYQVFPDSAAARGTLPSRRPPRSSCCSPSCSRACTGSRRPPASRCRGAFCSPPSTAGGRSGGLDGPVRVGDPVAPRAGVERGLDAEQVQREARRGRR